MTRCAISVVIPTYQRAERLPPLILALQEQRGDFDFEVLIVDNGTTDATRALLMGVEDPRFTVLRIDQNRGPVPARNAGWQAARADIVAFTDDDCMPDAHWLAGLLDGFARADVVQGRTLPNPKQRHRFGVFSHTRRVVHEDGFYATSNIAYRRGVLEATDGFDEHFYFGGEDTDLGWRAKALGFRTHFCHDALVYHDISSSDFVGMLRIQRQWCGMVRVAERHPGLRARFPAGPLWRPLQRPALMGLAAVMLAAWGMLVGAWPWIGVAVLGVLPYGYSRVFLKPQPARLPARIAALPGSLIVDLVGLYWHLREAWRRPAGTRDHGSSIWRRMLPAQRSGNDVTCGGAVPPAGVVYVMKRWARPSELWMQRMLEGIADDVRLIVAWRPPVRRWRGIPLLPLGSSRRQLTWLWDCLRQRRILSSAQWDSQRLYRACMDPRTRCVLVHYANIALRHADVWRALEKPVWVHVHGHDIAFGATHDDDPERAICPPGYAERVCALAAHVRFIANSQDSLERLCAIGVPRDRVVLKYLGVPELAPRAEPAPAPDGGLNFLFLGRLVEWKGPHFVVRAWARYRRAGGRGRLWVAGDGPLREECRAIASAEGVEDDIRWLGAVDAAQGASLREDAHVFVVHNNEGRRTRRVEALGVAILEAMAAGLPVLSGRSGGVGETVAHGETGLLCAPGDIDEQAEHMLMLYRDPALRARLREGATERIRRHFSAAAEQATLRQLLGSRDVGSSAQSPAPAVEPQG